MERPLNRKDKGQHLLTDEEALDFFAQRADKNTTVIEVGPGSGNITQRIARFAKRVIGFEADTRFSDDLEEVRAQHPNVEVNYKDILGVDLKKVLKNKSKNEKYQIMSNLPFHISEPFLKKLVDLPIEEAVLILGDQMAERIQNDNPDSLSFGRTGSLVQTFFDTSIIKKLGRSSFEPAPSTESVITVLTPKPEAEIRANPKTSILARLFRTEEKHSPTGKVLKEAMENLDGGGKQRGKDERNKYNRRQSRQELRDALRHGNFDRGQIQYQVESVGARELRKLGVPESILTKPFSNLDNQELRVLVSALERRFGK